MKAPGDKNVTLREQIIDAIRRDPSRDNYDLAIELGTSRTYVHDVRRAIGIPGGDYRLDAWERLVEADVFGVRIRANEYREIEAEIARRAEMVRASRRESDGSVDRD